MNANQIVNIVVRMVIRKLVRSGVNAVGNRMTDAKEGNAKAPDAAKSGKRAKQTLRMLRRLR